MLLKNNELIHSIWDEGIGKGILKWEGVATDLFVTDIPLDCLGTTVDIILKHIDHAEIVLSDSPSDEDFISVNEQTIELIKEIPDGPIEHVLSGMLDDCCDLQFYLYVYPEEESFEIEMVFWNDSAFPDEGTIECHQDTLGRIIAIPQEIRRQSERIRCVLTSECKWEGVDLFSVQKKDEVVVW